MAESAVKWSREENKLGLWYLYSVFVQISLFLLVNKKEVKTAWITYGSVLA